MYILKRIRLSACYILATIVSLFALSTSYSLSINGKYKSNFSGLINAQGSTSFGLGGIIFLPLLQNNKNLIFTNFGGVSKDFLSGNLAIGYRHLENNSLTTVSGLFNLVNTDSGVFKQFKTELDYQNTVFLFDIGGYIPVGALKQESISSRYFSGPESLVKFSGSPAYVYHLNIRDKEVDSTVSRRIFGQFYTDVGLHLGSFNKSLLGLKFQAGFHSTRSDSVYYFGPQIEVSYDLFRSSPIYEKILGKNRAYAPQFNFVADYSYDKLLGRNFRVGLQAKFDFTANNSTNSSYLEYEMTQPIEDHILFKEIQTSKGKFTSDPYLATGADGQPVRVAVMGSGSQYTGANLGTIVSNPNLGSNPDNKLIIWDTESNYTSSKTNNLGPNQILTNGSNLGIYDGGKAKIVDLNQLLPEGDRNKTRTISGPSGQDVIHVDNNDELSGVYLKANGAKAIVGSSAQGLGLGQDSGLLLYNVNLTGGGVDVNEVTISGNNTKFNGNTVKANTVSFVNYNQDENLNLDTPKVLLPANSSSTFNENYKLKDVNNSASLDITGNSLGYLVTNISTVNVSGNVSLGSIYMSAASSNLNLNSGAGKTITVVKGSTLSANTINLNTGAVNLSAGGVSFNQLGTGNLNINDGASVNGDINTNMLVANVSGNVSLGNINMSDASSKLNLNAGAGKTITVIKGSVLAANIINLNTGNVDLNAGEINFNQVGTGTLNINDGSIITGTLNTNMLVANVSGNVSLGSINMSAVSSILNLNSGAGKTITVSKESTLTANIINLNIGTLDLSAGGVSFNKIGIGTLNINDGANITGTLTSNIKTTIVSGNATIASLNLNNPDSILNLNPSSGKTITVAKDSILTANTINLNTGTIDLSAGGVNFNQVGAGSLNINEGVNITGTLTNNMAVENVNGNITLGSIEMTASNSTLNLNPGKGNSISLLKDSILTANTINLGVGIIDLSAGGVNFNQVGAGTGNLNITDGVSINGDINTNMKTTTVSGGNVVFSNINMSNPSSILNLNPESGKTMSLAKDSILSANTINLNIGTLDLSAGGVNFNQVGAGTLNINNGANITGTLTSNIKTTIVSGNATIASLNLNSPNSILNLNPGSGKTITVAKDSILTANTINFNQGSISLSAGGVNFNQVGLGTGNLNINDGVSVNGDINTNMSVANVSGNVSLGSINMSAASSILNLNSGSGKTITLTKVSILAANIINLNTGNLNTGNLAGQGPNFNQVGTGNLNINDGATITGILNTNIETVTISGNVTISSLSLDNRDPNTRLYLKPGSGKTVTLTKDAEVKAPNITLGAGTIDLSAGGVSFVPTFSPLTSSLLIDGANVKGKLNSSFNTIEVIGNVSLGSIYSYDFTNTTLNLSPGSGKTITLTKDAVIEMGNTFIKGGGTLDLSAGGVNFKSNVYLHTDVTVKGNSTPPLPSPIPPIGVKDLYKNFNNRFDYLYESFK